MPYTIFLYAIIYIAILHSPCLQHNIMQRLFPFCHAAAALHDASSSNVPSVQSACCAEPGNDNEQKTTLFEIAHHWRQKRSANGPHSDHEEWKMTQSHNALYCTIDANERSTIIARDGSLSNITVSYCTCASGHIMINTAQIVIVAVGLHQFLQWAPSCVENFIISVCKTVSALGIQFRTCPYPMSVKNNSSTYQYALHHATLSWQYKTCFSLDCITQASTFCSQDHYRLHQKRTFYKSAIGKEWHMKHSY